MRRNLYQVRIIDEHCNAKIFGENVLFTSIKKASFVMRESCMIPIRRSRDGRESVKEYYDTMTKLTWVIIDNDLSPQPLDPKQAKII